MALVLVLAACPPGGVAESRPPRSADVAADARMSVRVRQARAELARQRSADGAALPGAELPVEAIPAGRHVVTKAFPQDVHVKGAGRDETIIVVPRGVPGARVDAGRRLVVSDLTLILQDPQTNGLVVLGEAEVRRVKVVGGKAAVRVESGRVRVDDLVTRDGRAAVEVRGGRALVQQLRSKGTRAAALFVSGGRLAGDDLVLEDVDYGLVTRPEGRFDLRGLTIRTARWAGLGLVGGGGRIEGLRVTGHSGHGAVLVNDMREVLLLSEVELVGVRAVGLQLIRADARVDRLRIDGVAADAEGQGAGVLAMESRLELTRADVTRTASEGIAAQLAELRVRDADVREAGGPGIMAWRGSRIRLEGAHVEAGGEAALAATEDGRVEAHRTTLVGGKAPAASCEDDAAILLDESCRLEGTTRGCVKQGAAVRAPVTEAETSSHAPAAEPDPPAEAPAHAPAAEPDPSAEAPASSSGQAQGPAAAAAKPTPPRAPGSAATAPDEEHHAEQGDQPGG